MLTDPFASPICSESVGPLDAVLRGIPDGACLNLTLSPWMAFAGLIGFGLIVACLQMLVKGALFGRKDAYRASSENPENQSLRERANRARAGRDMWGAS